MTRIIITLAFSLFFSFVQAQNVLQIKYSDGSPHLNLLDDVYLFISDGLSEYLHPIEAREIVTPQGYQVSISHAYYSIFIADDSHTVIRKLEDGTRLFTTYKPEQLVWHLTNETKEILGYQCQKAILSKDSARELGTDPQLGDIVAWFTPEIDAQLGPWKYGGLPGLILEITYTIWAGRRILATEIKTIEREITLPDDMGFEVEKEDLWKKNWNRREIKKLKESLNNN